MALYTSARKKLQDFGISSFSELAEKLANQNQVQEDLLEAKEAARNRLKTLVAEKMIIEAKLEEAKVSIMDPSDQRRLISDGDSKCLQALERLRKFRSEYEKAHRLLIKMEGACESLLDKVGIEWKDEFVDDFIGCLLLFQDTFMQRVEQIDILKQNLLQDNPNKWKTMEEKLRETVLVAYNRPMGASLQNSIYSEPQSSSDSEDGAKKGQPMRKSKTRKGSSGEVENPKTSGTIPRKIRKRSVVLPPTGSLPPPPIQPLVLDPPQATATALEHHLKDSHADALHRPRSDRTVTWAPGSLQQSS
eukprot:TRINITY_DN10604_c0_g1_i1.p1 TRINITY_DN10604_c0_g1~~TRINITY_DN10604_c0_g1_i1.p1  ORF type:complete len:326 (+),score=79.67 TRINITY_DN10604_c0_g1_i1:67-978(+)